MKKIVLLFYAVVILYLSGCLNNKTKKSDTIKIFEKNETLIIESIRKNNFDEVKRHLVICQ